MNAETFFLFRSNITITGDDLTKFLVQHAFSIKTSECILCREREIYALSSLSVPSRAVLDDEKVFFGGNIVVKEVLHPLRNFSVVCKPDLTKRRLPSVLIFLPALSCCGITIETF
jgi:hypothetical protein